jgi:hypothetical protein
MHRSRLEWLWRTLALLLFAVVAVAALYTPSEAETRYCKVQSDNPDAVLLPTADNWGEPVDQLWLNCELEVLDDKSSKHYVKVRNNKSGKEGWAPRSILSEKKSEGADPNAAALAGAESSAMTSKGFTKEIEEDLSKKNDGFKEGVAVAEKLEQTINEKLGGNAKDPDAAKVRGSFRNFGEQGGLMKNRP